MTGQAARSPRCVLCGSRAVYDQYAGRYVHEDPAVSLAVDHAARVFASAKPCCAEHNDCDRPGEMVCCDDCPDIATCACGHGWHLHDCEAVPAHCVICDSAERCTPSNEERG